ncbi:hypothetical protein DFH27DRAFT_651956 [Peziza echinospora]|nr:hypothetical protein DFH27DRAFT_651956 [Peziza echinospora]
MDAPHIRALSIFASYFLTIFLCIHTILTRSILLPLPQLPSQSSPSPSPSSSSSPIPVPTPPPSTTATTSKKRKNVQTPPKPTPQTTLTTPPATRQKIILFTALAALSLALTWYHMLSYLHLSYTTSLAQLHLIDRESATSTTTLLYRLSRWLKNSRLFEDAYRIVVEREQGRWWWSQQIFLGCFAWGWWLASGAGIGAEGSGYLFRAAFPAAARRGGGGRGGRWTLVAYMLFAQLVSLSVAIDLYCVDLLVESERERRRVVLAAGGAAAQLQPPQNNTATAAAAQKKKEVVDTKPQLPTTKKKPQSQLDKSLEIILPILLATNFIATAMLPSHLPAKRTSTPSPPLTSTSSSSPSPSSSSSSSLFLPLLLIPHISLFLPLLLPTPPSRPLTHKLLTYCAAASVICHWIAWRDMPTPWLETVFGVWGRHPAVSSVSWDVVMVGVAGIAWAGVGGRKEGEGGVGKAVKMGVQVVGMGVGAVATAFSDAEGEGWQVLKREMVGGGGV